MMRFFLNKNEELDSLVASFFSDLSKINDKEFGGVLSIMLLGSLSRGEGTWIKDELGVVQILSDIEFFTIYPKCFNRFHDFDCIIEELRQKYFSNQNNNLFHIENTYICKGKLRFIEKKLITYDALMTGKNVVGKDVKSYMPRITLRNINYIDIKDILAHRIFSILYYKFSKPKDNSSDEYHYVVSKNILDLMIMYLLIHGKIASGFANRLHLLKRSNILPEKHVVFEHCLAIKMKTQPKNSFSTEELEKEFLFLSSDLFQHFSIPWRTYYYNFFHIVRRKLGILKRSYKIRTFPITQNKHIKLMLEDFSKRQISDDKFIVDQYILNGYPVSYLRQKGFL